MLKLFEKQSSFSFKITQTIRYSKGKVKVFSNLILFSTSVEKKDKKIVKEFFCNFFIFLEAFTYNFKSFRIFFSFWKRLAKQKNI